MSPVQRIRLCIVADILCSRLDGVTFLIVTFWRALDVIFQIFVRWWTVEKRLTYMSTMIVMYRMVRQSI